jgi:hypothetical protein
VRNSKNGEKKCEKERSCKNNGKSAIYVGRAKNPSGAPFSVQLQANLFISATGTTSL